MEKRIRESETRQVKIYIEEKYSSLRGVAVEGNFIFTAIDDNHKPIRLLK